MNISMLNLLNSIISYGKHIYTFDYEDFLKLNKFDLRTLYGIFKEYDNTYKMCDYNLNNMNKILSLESLELGRSQYKKYDDEFIYYGLIYKKADLLLSEVFCDIEIYFDPNDNVVYDEIAFMVNDINITYREVESILIFYNSLMCNFGVAYLYPIQFLNYLLLCQSNMKLYNKECFDNFFIMSFSNHIEYEDIRNNIDFGKTKNGIGLRLFRKGILISEVLEIFFKQPSIKNFLKKEYQINDKDIETLIKDISCILKVFEKNSVFIKE